QAKENGYLFFRNLLDPERVIEVRHQILSICRDHGWLMDGSEVTEGIANPDIQVVESKDPRWQAFYDDVLKIRDFHALALEAPLIRAFEVLFGEHVLPHSRNICRLVFPDTDTHSTPPHQDNYFIGGSDETWTAWIPCGDCPEELGGLAVARGSHRRGKLETFEGVGPGGRQVPVEEDSVWVGGDYLCGDVIILHSLTIHQGRDNESADRLRISADYRYQPRSHPVRDDSLQPHMNWLTWEDVYKKWDESDPVKYYWQAWDLDVVAREVRV
ncbi:MAG: phytanoyl-CoA dioxygenase family protein, partial [Gemmatimonadota bacterium]|nr:phytanoyl-CoA dioxygenase family protein [Gemmatimonadota bacterium]